MPKYMNMTLRFDVTGLSIEQVTRLKQDLLTATKASTPRPTEVVEVCPYCNEVRDQLHDECGGEDEGICTGYACVLDYLRSTDGNLAHYVRAFCRQHGTENTLVPYRADGLTYFQQLAYYVAEYHDLPLTQYEEAKKHLGLEVA